MYVAKTSPWHPGSEHASPAFEPQRRVRNWFHGMQDLLYLRAEMYSCVFWCEFIDFVGFFWLLLCDESDRGHTIAAKKPTKSMNSHQKTR